MPTPYIAPPGIVRRIAEAAPSQKAIIDWESQAIYFTFTDRFYDGDLTNDFGVDKSNLCAYHGGDLRGIIDRLDYIKGLGMTALWISPPMVQQTRHQGYEGFHGYWPVDFYHVDPRQGDMATLRELVQKAHQKGLKVLLDLPLNQTAWEHPWLKDPKKRDTWYHHNGNVTNWDDPVQCETYDLLGLPDLAQENPEVERELIKVAKFWIDQSGIDGFRLDAVKHVHRAFWPRFAKAIHEHAGPGFLLLGEDFIGDPLHVGRYQKEGLDALFDFPLHGTIQDTLGRGKPLSRLAARLAEEAVAYEHPGMMSVFLDNHDLTRFVTIAGQDALRKLKLALAFVFTINRIPCVYMGTEVGMAGIAEGHDHLPYNRADMEFGKNAELTAYFTKLGTLRQATPALRHGRYVEISRDDAVFAYERVLGDAAVLVVLNGSRGHEHRELTLPAEGPLLNGMCLRDVLTGKEIFVRDGKVAVDLPYCTPGIFLTEK